MIDLAIIDVGHWFSVIWDLINGSMGYVYVFLFMTIESSFIPFPSEIVVPPAAYVAASSDALNIWGVGISATLGALAGSIINYLLAMWVGRPLIYKFADSRLGHICMLNGEKVDRAEKIFRQTWRHIHLHRSTHPGDSSAHQHPRRIGAHELWQSSCSSPLPVPPCGNAVALLAGLVSLSHLRSNVEAATACPSGGIQHLHLDGGICHRSHMHNLHCLELAKTENS